MAGVLDSGGHGLSRLQVGMVSRAGSGVGRARLARLSCRSLHPLSTECCAGYRGVRSLPQAHRPACPSSASSICSRIRRTSAAMAPSIG